MASSGEINPFAAEHGRIRLGRKTSSRAGREALETFRFTSPDERAIEDISGAYGGRPAKWEDPKASPRKQWEVITEADRIEVWIPRGALTIQFERWSGSGMQSYCDGENVTVFKGDDQEVKPCVCVAKGERVCDVKVKLQCILPVIDSFAGTWRMQTGSQFAAREMPAVEQMLQSVQQHTIVPGTLSIEQRQSKGGKHKFVVPKLSINVGFRQMMEGSYTERQVLLPGAEVPELEEGPDAEVIEITRGDNDA